MRIHDLLIAETVSVNGSSRLSVSSLSSLRDLTHNDCNGIVSCSNDHRPNPPSEPSFESSEGNIMEEAHKSGKAILTEQKSYDSQSKSDVPLHEVKTPVFADEVSVLSADENVGREERGVLQDCGLLPNNCLPCLASTVNSADKRRPLSPGPPSSKKKMTSMLSFKWKEGHANATLCK